VPVLALPTWEGTRTRLLSESTTLEDADLASEAANPFKLESSSATYEQQPMAGPFAVGGRTSVLTGASLLAPVALVCRRSRRT